MNDIFTNTRALEVLCIDIIKGAKEYFEKNPPKKGNATVRSRVEYWVEHYLHPAIECVIDITFEDE